MAPQLNNTIRIGLASRLVMIAGINEFPLLILQRCVCRHAGKLGTIKHPAIQKNLTALSDY
jgi:hypothetical protein